MADTLINQSQADLRRLENEMQRVRALGDQFASSLSRGLEDVALRGQSLSSVMRNIGQNVSGQVFQSAFKSLSSELQRITGFGDQFGKSLNRAFDGLVLRGKGLKDVVSSLGQDLSQMALQSAFQPLQQGVGSLLSGLVSTGGSSGGLADLVKSFGLPLPFARGGVVSSPTYFPLAGGRAGVMGERGAEAILPLRRGADGRLGVAAESGGGVQVNFTVSSPDAESFRRSESQISAMLARAIARGERNL